MPNDQISNEKDAGEVKDLIFFIYKISGAIYYRVPQKDMSIEFC